ncbi:YdcF family protein [Vulcaniibacterium tengchongense]|uniref:Uncharacterized SAM-binding protein YcdF (DUF218 family) n=1 Tax=Vulcaniibacterium tengchongense TaxID=1273429 RepID=A0A3N4W6E7_9GAMM|nr:YdcF family protein [Vulcaniibacterium tengchongense]RPE81660.1 uncharacterized SAM-binding protein YcdF (DUF218 family) [Vulcaniibacterium tengchongense]
MPSFLQEFLVGLTYPPALSFWLLACAALAALLHWRRLGALMLAVALGWSGLWSLPSASDWLRGLLESRYPVVDEAELPRADAIVVLGGGARYGWLDRPDVRPEQLRSSRLAAGARAWLAGRAPIVILSGGGEGGITEARRMAAAIARLGVPESALVLEERSRDTRDNARYTAELAEQHGVHRVLLVTSALHMPRASLLFRQAGIEAIPVPVPERATRASWRERWLPSRSALWRSGRALKELAGLAAVHLAG